MPLSGGLGLHEEGTEGARGALHLFWCPFTWGTGSGIILRDFCAQVFLLRFSLLRGWAWDPLVQGVWGARGGLRMCPMWSDALHGGSSRENQAAGGHRVTV